MEKVYFPLDSTTGQHKNHGFVEFEHQESVPYSILLLNSVCLCGRPLRVGTVGKTDVFPATMATADAAVSSSVPSTTVTSDCVVSSSNSTMTAEDEFAAAVLAAQLELGLPLPMPLPMLKEALGLPSSGPSPLFNSTNEPIQPSGPTPLFDCTPFSANGRLPSPMVTQTGPTPLFSCASLPSTSEVSSSQLPPSGPTPLFGCLPLPSANGKILGQRLSPPPTSSSPPHLGLPPPSTNDVVHPTLGQRLSPPTELFDCNPPPPWVEINHIANGNDGRSHTWDEAPNRINDHIANGNDGHSHTWDEGSNRINDRSWERPSNCDVNQTTSWEHSPRVTNGNHMYHSRSSRWSPDHMADENTFHDDPISPWEQPPSYHDDTTNSFPFPLRSNHLSSHSETEREVAITHSSTMFSESHPFTSDHTHMHQNRVLHIDDKPSWVTKETKEQIRNHHLTKLTETLAQYQELYSKSK